MVDGVPVQGDIIKINLDPKKGHEQAGYRPYICLSNKIIITKANEPKKGTLEYLFKDYSGESFNSDLINPLESVGNEKW